MKQSQLGNTNTPVSKFSLGTMTFGEQVNESDSKEILSYAFDNGINFIDTAEMYSAPARPTTYGLSEKIVGSWLKTVDRSKVVLATKAAGPGRYSWIREGQGLTKKDIIKSCEGSLRRLDTDYIDVYYIHWPERYAPVFGELYFNPEREKCDTTIFSQLDALDGLVKAGKIRYVALSNETPYGVSEFLRASYEFKLPKIQAVQNPYSLTNRSYENGLDEMLYHNQISMISYSPLGFGMLTGKYDNGFDGVDGRLSRYSDMRTRRWCRPDAITASKRYNDLAKSIGMTPVKFALSYCYNKHSIASTILGVTSLDQLKEALVSVTEIPKEIHKIIDEIRWSHRDPSQ